MINLPNVTLYSIVHDGGGDMPNRVARVMNWCMAHIHFRRSMLLTHIKPKVDCKADVIQIPAMKLIPDVQVFIVHTLSALDVGDYLMGVHEDGYPVDFSMWSSEFLKYDYIGAPWGDEVVGNNGFYICSKKFIQCSARLPFLHSHAHSDNYCCRDHKKTLEGMGVRFAPFGVAVRFSVEIAGQGQPSFGYHGRSHKGTKHAQGWTLINKYEEGLKK